MITSCNEYYIISTFYMLIESSRAPQIKTQRKICVSMMYHMSILRLVYHTLWSLLAQYIKVWYRKLQCSSAEHLPDLPFCKGSIVSSYSKGSPLHSAPASHAVWQYVVCAGWPLCKSSMGWGDDMQRTAHELIVTYSRSTHLCVAISNARAKTQNFYFRPWNRQLRPAV